MTWRVLIHPLVFDVDFRRIASGAQRAIIKAIRKKLSVDPIAYGKALTGDLKGFYRLRVGDFRVIYSVLKREIVVKVVKVGIRRDAEVYEEMMRRYPKIRDYLGT